MWGILPWLRAVLQTKTGGLCVILFVTKEIGKGQNKKRLLILGFCSYVLQVMEPICRNVAAHAAKNLF